jgi:hypothetical protein
MFIYDHNDVQPPKLGDMFEVVEITGNVLDPNIGGGMGTHVELRPVVAASNVIDECLWTEEPDMLPYNVYRTKCGQLHGFEAGGPAENKYLFCQYCGRKLTTNEEG